MEKKYIKHSLNNTNANNVPSQIFYYFQFHSVIYVYIAIEQRYNVTKLDNCTVYAHGDRLVWARTFCCQHYFVAQGDHSYTCDTICNRFELGFFSLYVSCRHSKRPTNRHHRCTHFRSNSYSIPTIKYHTLHTGECKKCVSFSFVVIRLENMQFLDRVFIY